MIEHVVWLLFDPMSFEHYVLEMWFEDGLLSSIVLKRRDGLMFMIRLTQEPYHHTIDVDVYIGDMPLLGVDDEVANAALTIITRLTGRMILVAEDTEVL